MYVSGPRHSGSSELDYHRGLQFGIILDQEDQAFIREKIRLSSPRRSGNHHQEDQAFIPEKIKLSSQGRLRFQHHEDLVSIMKIWFPSRRFGFHHKDLVFITKIGSGTFCLVTFCLVTTCLVHFCLGNILPRQLFAQFKFA